MKYHPERRLSAIAAWLGRVAPRLSSLLKRWYGNYLAAPANTVMGVRIVEVTSDSRRVVVRLKDIRNKSVAPGRGELVADYSLSGELLGRIGRELAAGGRSEVAAESCVRDMNGELVAKLSATYVVLRREH